MEDRREIEREKWANGNKEEMAIMTEIIRGEKNETFSDKVNIFQWHSEALSKKSEPIKEQRFNRIEERGQESEKKGTKK